MNFKLWIESEYIIDKLGKDNADRLHLAKAANSFISNKTSRRTPNPNYDPNHPERPYFGSEEWPEYKKSNPDWESKTDPWIHHNDIAPATFSLKGKRIVISKYRNAPIVLPIKNKDISVDSHDGFKPWGGLWYSFGERWIDWASREAPNFLGMFVHEKRIDSDKICKINDSESLEEFEQKYGRETDFGQLKEIRINWPDVVKDYSGVEVSGSGLSRNGWQTYWDIESGCIWDQSGLKDSKLLYVYNVKTKQFVKPDSLGLYAGRSSKIKSSLKMGE